MVISKDGIRLEQGYKIVEIQPERDVWLEKTINGKVESFRIFWSDLNKAQKDQMLLYCDIADMNLASDHFEARN